MHMVIPSQIKTKYSFNGGTKAVAQSLHIRVGEGFDVQKGDTIILYPKKAHKIEIKRKETVPVKDVFRPYPDA